MSIPTAVITGTISYLIIGALFLALVFSSKTTGILNKDNAEIGYVIVTVGTFSTWLFWVSAWMHQWHPLIKPIYEA